MGFLDNSGDIILDAVLTDTGRYRLAKGDGSFKIVKFALGDDEINYGTYNKNHPSGSAYYDLQIMQTPVLEAFTNNASSMKTKLISLPRTNLLYLPILKIDHTSDDNLPFVNSGLTTGSYVVLADEISTQFTTNSPGGMLSKNVNNPGVLNGADPPSPPMGYISIHQGLDTTEISPSFNLDSDLVETGYIIQIDNRLGAIASRKGNTAAVSFIDDDNIATYYVSINTDPQYVTDIALKPPASTNSDTPDTPIRGPRGTKLQFAIQSSVELQTSTYLFETLGGTLAAADSSDGAAIRGSACPASRFIDTIIKVTGQTTGYRIDIPVRFVKKQ